MDAAERCMEARRAYKGRLVSGKATGLVALESDQLDLCSTEEFSGSDDRPYEWKLEIRNMRKVSVHPIVCPDKNKRLTPISSPLRDGSCTVLIGQNTSRPRRNLLSGDISSK